MTRKTTRASRPGQAPHRPALAASDPNRHAAGIAAYDSAAGGGGAMACASSSQQHHLLTNRQQQQHQPQDRIAAATSGIRIVQEVLRAAHLGPRPGNAASADHRVGGGDDDDDHRAGGPLHPHTHHDHDHHAPSLSLAHLPPPPYEAAATHAKAPGEFVTHRRQLAPQQRQHQQQQQPQHVRTSDHGTGRWPRPNADGGGDAAGGRQQQPRLHERADPASSATASSTASSSSPSSSQSSSSCFDGSGGGSDSDDESVAPAMGHSMAATAAAPTATGHLHHAEAAVPPSRRNLQQQHHQHHPQSAPQQKRRDTAPDKACTSPRSMLRWIRHNVVARAATRQKRRNVRAFGPLAVSTWASAGGGGGGDETSCVRIVVHAIRAATSAEVDRRASADATTRAIAVLEGVVPGLALRRGVGGVAVAAAASVGTMSTSSSRHGGFCLNENNRESTAAAQPPLWRGVSADAAAP